jgi:hypothetical protein
VVGFKDFIVRFFGEKYLYCTHWSAGTVHIAETINRRSTSTYICEAVEPRGKTVLFGAVGETQDEVNGSRRPSGYSV